MARAPLALAVLLALAVPATAPFSEGMDPAVPTIQVVPADPPRADDLVLVAGVKPPADLEDDLLPPVPDPTCAPGVRVTLDGWHREVGGWRTVEMLGLGLAGGQASVGVNGWALLQSPDPAAWVDRVETTVEGLPIEGAALATSDALLSGGAAMRIAWDEVYYVWVPFPYVFDLSEKAVLPPGAAVEPLATCDPDQALPDALPEAAAMLLAEADHASGWTRVGAPRIEPLEYTAPQLDVEQAAG